LVCGSTTSNNLFNTQQGVLSTTQQEVIFTTHKGAFSNKQQLSTTRNKGCFLQQAAKGVSIVATCEQGQH